MNLLFVPRQEEDPRGGYIGMYYKYDVGEGELTRADLCEIETALLAGEKVTISKAPEPVIRSLRDSLLPAPPPAPFIPTGAIA